MIEARGGPKREILVFEVGGRRYGLPAAEIRELLRAVTILPLPLAPAGVVGVINLRGTVVPVMDLRARLGLPPKPLEPADHLVIIGADERPVALLIDRILELVPLEVTDLAAGEDEDGLGEVAQQSEGLLPLLDPRTLVVQALAAVPSPAPLGVAAGAETEGPP